MLCKRDKERRVWLDSKMWKKKFEEEGKRETVKEESAKR